MGAIMVVLPAGQAYCMCIEGAQKGNTALQISQDTAKP